MSGFGGTDPNLMGIDTGQGPYVQPTPRHPEAINEVPISSGLMKSYVSPVPQASFHTPGGTRITFVHNFYKTDIKHIQDYLDYEIAMRNPYLRAATSEEVNTAAMREDPKGFLTTQVRAEVEAQTRDKLMAAIKDRLAKGDDIDDVLAGRANPVEVTGRMAAQYDPLAADINEDAARLATTDALQQRNPAKVTDVGSGTLVETSSAPAALEPAPVESTPAPAPSLQMTPHLGGIQSSTDVKANSAGSAAS